MQLNEFVIDYRDLFETTSEVVTVNKELNPKIWNQGRMRPEIRTRLLLIADKFIESIGIDLDIEDITVTGSMANYTWNSYSDLDLHVVIPGTPSEAERELYTAKKALWGEQRDITVKGIPVECYVQGSAEPHHSTGVYSLHDDAWLVEPKKVKPQVNDGAVRAKHQELAWMVGTALDSNSIEKLTAIKQKITQMRKSGLARAGEWSTENLVFKLLRNQGLIDKVTDRIRRLEDQQLSLEQTQQLD
jgi:ribosomal protein L31E